MNPISLQGRYRTRRGDEVRILCIDASASLPVVVLRDEWAWMYDLSGKFSGENSDFDLIEVTPPPDSPLLAAARKVVEARHYSGDDGWDKLKNAISELEGVIDGQ